MEQFLLSLSEGVTQLLVVVIFSLLSYGLKKGNDFIKSKLSKNQYEVFSTISQDIYDYVEREFGGKLKEAGSAKLQRAMEVYKDQAAKHDLPYGIEDFKVQIEKINKKEQDKKVGIEG